MKTAKPYWTFAKASKMMDDEENCCRILQSERLIQMLPKYIGKLKTGIKEILDMDLGKYTEWVGGVLLGYNKVRLSQTSLPLDDQPLIPYTVHMDVIVFQPVIGKTLKCTVNEVAPDHIGCLALDYFNVSIPVPKTSRGRNGTNQTGMQILVEIRKIRNMHGIISIQGIFKAKLPGTMKMPSTPDKADSGILSGADEEVPMDTTMSDVDSVASVVMVPSGKRKKQSTPPVNVLSSSSDLDNSLESLGSPKKKKKKKHKDSRDDVDIADVKIEPPSTNASRKKIKDKKKKKKSFTQDDIDKILINTKEEVSMDTSDDDPFNIKEELSSPKTPDNSFGSTSHPSSSSSSGKKKKKQKHSKKEKLVMVKTEALSNVEENSDDDDDDDDTSMIAPKLPDANTSDVRLSDPVPVSKAIKKEIEHISSSPSKRKEKKKHKHSKGTSSAVKTEYFIDTTPGHVSHTAMDTKSPSKTKKTQDKLQKFTNSLLGKRTHDSAPSVQKSKTTPGSSEEKKAKKRKHSKHRSESGVAIKVEAIDDKLSVLNDIKPPKSGFQSNKGTKLKDEKRKKHKKP